MLIFSTILPFVQTAENAGSESICLPTDKASVFNEKFINFNLPTPPTTTTAEKIFKT